MENTKIFPISITIKGFYMKRFFRTLRKFGYILLITLAAVGIGIFGAVPIIPTNRKKENIFQTELVETKEDDFEVRLTDASLDVNH